MKKYSSLLIFILLLSSSVIYPSDKRMLMWFDATANFKRLSFTDSISYYLDKCSSLGFTDIVVDVKPITGEVLFKSRLAPEMKEWNGFTRTGEADFLNTFIREGHKRNLRIHASLNIFVAGHNYMDRGVVYDNHPEWQSVNYTDSGLVPITKLKHKYSAMLNPAMREVQLYEIEILRELVSGYDIDGIILDRVRYDGIEADFSPLSKQLFEEYAALKVENFPGDIFEWKKGSDGKPYRSEGRYFNKWLEWRASVIYNFISEARQAVKKIKPSIIFGDYTGAWYPQYYEVGVNWASSKYDPSKEYSWATDKYKNYGYAELLDLYTPGCYFFEVTKGEVALLNEETIKRGEAAMGQTKEDWYSVEGSAELAEKVTMSAAPVYGGLYVEQYKGHPQQFEKAVKMCLQKTDGLMIFDIVHIINNGWWNVLEKAVK